MRAAFLVMRDPRDFVTDYGLGIPPLEARGWQVDLVPWREPPHDWDSWDAVYICTPWDYPEDPALFMHVLESIDASGATLVNDLELVRWTLEKTYLVDLEARGAAIVPSSWHDRIDAGEIDSFFERHDAERVVIKPIIGANAGDTFLLSNPLDKARRAELVTLYRGRRYLVQPYLPAIETEGEYSLFYLGGTFSHAIRKVPARGDFRVQEEHGASIAALEPPAALVGTASQVLRLVDPAPVYARLDFVRGPAGRFLLMELELIEPSLYLRMDAAAPDRFARAFDTYVRKSLRPRAS